MKYISSLFLVAFLLLLPGEVFAQGGFVPCEGANCSACDLISLGNNLVDWLIGILTVVFAIIAVVAGFQLVTSGGNTEAKSAAKRKLTSALIGFVVVLAAWLLVDTVMRMLLAGGNGEIGGYGPWSDVECGTQTKPLVPVTLSNGTSPNATGLSEAQVSNTFSSNNIDVYSSGGCTDPSRSVCTGLAGMQQQTVDKIVQLDQACPNCNIGVTGGTETGVHKNPCHEAGTCADIDCRAPDGSSDSCSVAEIITIDQSATAVGADAVYEVATEGRKQQLVDEGADPNSIAVVQHITGEHFSVYTSN